MDRLTYRVASVDGSLAILAKQRAGVCLRAAPCKSSGNWDRAGVNIAACGEVGLRSDSGGESGNGDENGANHFVWIGEWIEKMNDCGKGRLISD